MVTAEDTDDDWWTYRKMVRDRNGGRRFDAESMRDLIYAKRLLDFIEEFPEKDSDRGYAKAVIRLTEMVYTAKPRMIVRAVMDIRPDIVNRVNDKGDIVWGTCLTSGYSAKGRARVNSIEFDRNFATVELTGSTVTLRFGDDMDRLYRMFLRANPDPPGDGVHWDYEVNWRSLGFYAPAPTVLDPAWDILEGRYADDCRGEGAGN